MCKQTTIGLHSTRDANWCPKGVNVGIGSQYLSLCLQPTYARQCEKDLVACPNFVHMLINSAK